MTNDLTYEQRMISEHSKDLRCRYIHFLDKPSAMTDLRACPVVRSLLKMEDDRLQHAVLRKAEPRYRFQEDAK